MGIFVILLLLISCMVIGIPVAFSLMLTSLCYLIVKDIPIIIILQRLFSGPDSFPLLAVPFFIFAAQVMNTAGVTMRIFKFANSLVGHIKGGLGHVNILASIIFAGMSGSAVADAGGLGVIEIAAMRDAGYDDDFTLAITASSSIIGPIIPPSVPAVIYGAMAGTSIGGLFIGGIIPGILMGAMLSILVFLYAYKRHYPTNKRESIKTILLSGVNAFIPMLTPLIIIGGIWTGWFTPTESAAVAAIYALILGVFVYREINISDIWKLLKKSAGLSSRGIFIVATAQIFGYVLAREQVAPKLSQFLFGITENPQGILLLIIAFLLVIGTFMEPVSAMIILIPVFNPMIRTMGIHPVHFGIIMILTLMIGLLTPPVGSVLYILSVVSGAKFEFIAKSVAIFIIPLIIVVLMIVFIPEIVLFLPRIMLGI